MKPIILRQHEVIHLRKHGSVIAWRVVKPQPNWDSKLNRMQEGYKDGCVRAVFEQDDKPNAYSIKCPYGRTGEGRFVAETWFGERVSGRGWQMAYLADGDEYNNWWDRGFRWISPILMKEAQSRFTVTLDVGLKRIQEVTEEEGYGSGYKRAQSFYAELDRRGSCAQLARLTGRPPTSPAAAFVRDIANESTPGSWDRNDYFWKITCTLKK